MLSSGTGLQYFAQISDAHVDMQFAVNSADNCLLHGTGMPCCRKNQIDESPFEDTTQWGLQTCDTSPHLFQQTVAWMKDHLPDLDFVVNTGDSADHHVLFQTRKGNIQAVTFVHNTLRSVFPDTPILNVLGNHDTFPIDQTVTQHFVYPEIATVWNLTSAQRDTFIRGGFYQQDMSNRLTVFVINSVFFDSHNIESKYVSQQDFRGQFSWIEEQLQKCQMEQRTVWFLNHEPPRSKLSNGQYDWYTSKLIELANTYGIPHQFFGHEHSDRFIVYGRHIGFITPSLLPAAHNPSFRLYEYNGTHISDYVQYSANLMNAIHTDVLDYRPLYRYSEVFGGAPTYNTYTTYYKSLFTNDTRYTEFCRHYWVGESHSCGNKEDFLQSLWI
jgi:hypothetical protein